MCLCQCSWLSDDVRHKCTFMSACHIKALLGTGRSYNAVASLWCHVMVASFGLFAIELMECLPGLSVL